MTKKQKLEVTATRNSDGKKVVLLIPMPLELPDDDYSSVLCNAALAAAEKELGTWEIDYSYAIVLEN